MVEAICKQGKEPGTKQEEMVEVVWRGKNPAEFLARQTSIPAVGRKSLVYILCLDVVILACTATNIY